MRRRVHSIPSVTYLVEGLEHSAEILVDPWGVPHIYATSFYDAFFVQGFNAARDRLWQIDLWRRRGLGKLSEVFGSSYLKQDKASRLFLYRGDMYSEWLSYGSDAERIATAFVNGINEYVELTRQNAELMPMEFKVLGYEPALWSPEDVVRLRSHGLGANIESEVTRAKVACKFGLEVDEIRQQLTPEWKTKIPEGLDPCSIPDNVLNLYILAKRSVTFDKQELQNTLNNLTQCSDALANKSIEDVTEGSNNWAISSRLTATGRPILANDPHRIHSIPSLRYIVHMNAPGLNVIGAGEPSLPGIPIGHNEYIAFGLTIFPLDQEDLYIHTTNPENPNEYKYKGSWKPMEIVDEEISVRASPPVKVELKFTCYGPVIYEDMERHTAFVVRAAWLDPGMAPYFSSIQYMRAQNWDEFLDAMNQWGAPPVNQIYADTNGNIGWKPGGRAPIRPNWDGLLPVPGDGRYEWAGFYDMHQMPVEYNPAQGWLATANQMNLPKDYPYQERKLSFEWPATFRYERISEFLNSASNTTLLDSLQLQTDLLSIPARRVVALLQGLESVDPKVSKALKMLSMWDYFLNAKSAPAALFEVWFSRHLRQAVVAKLVPPDALEIVGIGDTNLVINVLENPDARLGTDPQSTRNDILLSSLGKAIEDIEKKLGADMEQWAWGNLHQVFFEHPLSSLVDEATRHQINVAPKPQGGSEFTVNLTAYRTNSFRIIGGASWRMILDVGNWDNSFAMNSPGQSGNPQSVHYDDLFLRWINDQAFPLLYSRSAIETVVEQRFELLPSSSATKSEQQ